MWLTLLEVKRDKKSMSVEMQNTILSADKDIGKLTFTTTTTS